MKIGGRPLGSDCGVFVIAEIGVNHDGRLDRALQLVSSAATAGADAVKLQVFSADRLMHPRAVFAEYQKEHVQVGSPAEMLRQYELTDVELKAIAGAARNVNLSVVATPFSPQDVGRLVAVGVDAIKIASPDLVNRLLLSTALSAGLPLLVSTGASTLGEVTDAIGWLKAQGADFALLHCVSSYPTVAANAQLGWIRNLIDLTKTDSRDSTDRPPVVVGYSDHCDDPIAGALAVAAGADLIEKHLTYDRRAAGPDHESSLDADGFADYVRLIREARVLRGNGHRWVLPCENDVRLVSRQSLVAVRNIPEGRAIAADDLTCQRPGDGLSAAEIDAVIGRRSTRQIRAGEMLDWSMLQ